MTVRAVPALVVAALLVGCGGGPSLGSNDRRELGELVATAQSAAVAHDAAGAHEQLAALRARVLALETDGEISSTQADAIRSAADEVEGLLSLVTTTRPTLPPPPIDDDEGKGKDKGKGKGKD